MEQTDWDLRVPAIRWAYGAMHKNLSMRMILKMTSRVESIALGKNPHVITPITGTAHEDQNKEIMQLHEDKHM